MNKDQDCIFCGKHGVYAKNLCRSCYNRALKNEGIVVPRMSEQVRAKWKGLKVNGWEVIDTLPKGNFLLKCIYCGRTKIVVRESIKRQSVRPCVCHVEHLEPKTEKQARIYKAVIKNKGNAKKAAEELGMSRQAVWSVLETMRRNMLDG